MNKDAKDITYKYTMLQTKLNDMKPNMNSITQYKSTLLLKERERFKWDIRKIKESNRNIFKRNNEKI